MHENILIIFLSPLLHSDMNWLPSRARTESGTNIFHCRCDFWDIRSNYFPVKPALFMPVNTQYGEMVEEMDHRSCGRSGIWHVNYSMCLTWLKSYDNKANICWHHWDPTHVTVLFEIFITANKINISTICHYWWNTVHDRPQSWMICYIQYMLTSKE